MRDGHKILIGALAELDRLLPAVILANDQHPNPLDSQTVDEPAAGDMHLMLDLTVAFFRQAFQACFERRVSRGIQLTWQGSPVCAVVLVDTLARPALNKKEL